MVDDVPSSGPRPPVSTGSGLPPDGANLHAPTERRLDRLEVRMDQLEGSMRLIDVNTTTRLNSIDAKLVHVSDTLEPFADLATVIRGPANDPDDGLVSRLRSMEDWRTELRGALRLVTIIASLATLIPILIAIWTFAAVGHP